MVLVLVFGRGGMRRRAQSGDWRCEDDNQVTDCQCVGEKLLHYRGREAVAFSKRTAAANTAAEST
jgi:hypothetical protein